MSKTRLQILDEIQKTDHRLLVRLQQDDVNEMIKYLQENDISFPEFLVTLNKEPGSVFNVD